MRDEQPSVWQKSQSGIKFLEGFRSHNDQSETRTFGKTVDEQNFENLES